MFLRGLPFLFYIGIGLPLSSVVVESCFLVLLSFSSSVVF